jgi:HlyD family secretion protein
LKSKLRTFAIVVVLVLILAGLTWFLFFREGAERLIASGTIEVTEVVVGSKITGRVEEILFDEGDYVEEGSLIARLEAKELASMLRSGEAKFKQAKDDQERYLQLYQSEMISTQQYQASVSAYEVAAAALDAAKSQFDERLIKAPVSGTVLVRAVEAGELAIVGSAIVTMADLREVYLTVYLAEKDVGKVNLGEEVMVYVDSYPNEKFTGKISYISDKAEFTPKVIQTKEERVTQVFAIKIKIANPENKLKPGMPADAEFKWKSQ